MRFNPRNGASLDNNIDVTAHSLSLYHGNEQPKDINEIVIPQTSISIAEPIDVQIDPIDEVGNTTTQMYQLIGMISDESININSMTYHESH